MSVLPRAPTWLSTGLLQGEMIRDRIVVGIRDSQQSEKLQMDPNLTLEKAVAQSRQAESVKKQQAIIRCGQSQPQPANIDAVSPGRQQQQQQQPLRTKGPQRQYGSQLS